MNWDGRQAVYDTLGKQIPDPEAAEYTELVWTIIEQAVKLSNAKSASIPSEKSLYDHFQEQVKEMIISSSDGFSEEEAQKKQQMILQMSEMWGSFVGSPIQRQSLRFFWLEECIDGENLFVAGTYKKILARIAEPGMRATVKFRHKVKRIVSKEQGENPEVLVQVEGHEDEIFDEVVMTAPLGWLKRNQDVFVPELPLRMKESIASISYGHLDKVPHLIDACASTKLTLHFRFISISQLRFGTKPRLLMLAYRLLLTASTNPTLQLPVYHYTKEPARSRRNLASILRITLALHIGQNHRMREIATRSCGIRRQSTWQLCPALQHTQPYFSTSMDPSRSISRN